MCKKTWTGSVETSRGNLTTVGHGGEEWLRRDLKIADRDKLIVKMLMRLECDGVV